MLIYLLQIVAIDGSEINPLSVDKIILFPGETVDFIMDADQTGSLYWMRIRDLASDNDITPGTPEINEGWAIIDYGDSTDDPDSSYLTCSQSKPCDIFNCPFPVYPQNVHKNCIALSDATSTMKKFEMNQLYGLGKKKRKLVEKFYNFNFGVGSSVNVHKFSWPSSPLYQSTPGSIEPCPGDCGATTGCKCTYIDDIPQDEVIQLVLVSILPGEIYKSHHVIHLHGYNFAVVKMGFFEYDSTSGAWTMDNQDVKCDTSYPCARPRWAKKKPKGLNLKDPPVKNTVVVPSRGYTVIRFKSNNPGFWSFHCQQNLHYLEGMGMVLKVGDTFPPLPANFPVCSNFDWSSMDFNATQV